MRYRLHTLLIVLALIAVLIAAGLVRINHRRGVGGVIRDVKRPAPQVEQRDEEIDDLAAQKLRTAERYIEEQHQNSVSKQLDPSYPIYYPPANR